MKNRCASCQGKFGLVRHRPAFKSFCSQKCVDHHQVWLRAEVCKRKGWLDCLWSANVDVMPCLRTASGQNRIGSSRANLVRSPFDSGQDRWRQRRSRAGRLAPISSSHQVGQDSGSWLLEEGFGQLTPDAASMAAIVRRLVWST
jgi:hypothetical protein